MAFAGDSHRIRTRGVHRARSRPGDRHHRARLCRAALRAAGLPGRDRDDGVPHGPARAGAERERPGSAHDAGAGADFRPARTVAPGHGARVPIRRRPVRTAHAHQRRTDGDHRRGARAVRGVAAVRAAALSARCSDWVPWPCSRRSRAGCADERRRSRAAPPRSHLLLLTSAPERNFPSPSTLHTRRPLHGHAPLPLAPRKFLETGRTDAWWLRPVATFVALAVFVGYSTWAAFQGNHYTFGPYLSPFYSPELFGASGARLVRPEARLVAGPAALLAGAADPLGAGRIPLHLLLLPRRVLQGDVGRPRQLRGRASRARRTWASGSSR